MSWGWGGPARGRQGWLMVFPVVIGGVPVGGGRMMRKGVGHVMWLITS